MKHTVGTDLSVGISCKFCSFWLCITPSPKSPTLLALFAGIKFGDTCDPYKEGNQMFCLARCATLHIPISTATFGIDLQIIDGR